MQPTELGQLPWLAPTLGALFAWGIAQGLVKKYIGEVSAASFCLYYAIANAVVNVAFWAFHDAPPAFAPEGRSSRSGACSPTCSTASPGSSTTSR